MCALKIFLVRNNNKNPYKLQRSALLVPGQLWNLPAKLDKNQPLILTIFGQKLISFFEKNAKFRHAFRYKIIRYWQNAP